MSAVALNSSLSSNLAPSSPNGAPGASPKVGDAFGSVLFGLGHAHGQHAPVAAANVSDPVGSRLPTKTSGKGSNETGASGSDETSANGSGSGSRSPMDAVFAALGLTDAPAQAGAGPEVPVGASTPSPSLPGPSAMQLLNPAALPRSAGEAPASSAPSARDWDLSGATPLKSLLASDPTMGLSGFQVRTHLAASGSLMPSALVDFGATAPTAGPVGTDRSSNPATGGLSFAAALDKASPEAKFSPEAPTLSSAQAGLAYASGSSAGSGGAVSASSPRRGSGSQASATPQGARVSPMGAQPVSSHASINGSAAVVGAEADFTGERGSSSGSGSSRANAVADAGVDAASAGVAATVETAPASSPAGVAVGPVTLNQAVDIIAEQSQSLTSQATSAAATPGASHTVKELEITLDPQDLGSISVKLRMTNGKLSVSIGVSSAKTLSAMESDRQDIVSRLTASAPSLAGLTLHAQGAGESGANAQTSGGQQDASDLYDLGRGQAQPDSAQARSGGSGANGGSRDRGAAGGDAPVVNPTTPQNNGAGGAGGDLMV